MTMKKVAFSLIVIFLVIVFWLDRKTQPEPLPNNSWSLDALLGDAPDGFLRVTEPRDFVFPKDHAMHPEFRNEWWYFTGRLDAPDRPLGFQFTLFRFGMNPPNTEASNRSSAWASEHLWMAHLALSDGGDGKDSAPRFYQAERFARDTLGLAGATENRWWLRDWEVLATDSGWHLKAQTDEFEINLKLDPMRDATLQGDRGFSQKGPEVGNASHYYSMTRLRATGEVVLQDSERLSVEGLAWLDREWGSGQLSQTQSGWDWFAIHLDDGRDLMVYRLRNLDGSASEFSAGVLVGPDGQRIGLSNENFLATPTAWWQDEQGVLWPTHWQVQVPDHGLDLEVRPLFDAQRWTKSVAYWEGAIDVHQASTQVGRGYLELSGYADGQTPGRRASQTTPTPNE